MQARGGRGLFNPKDFYEIAKSELDEVLYVFSRTQFGPQICERLDNFDSTDSHLVFQPLMTRRGR